jgi:hypothetical protein
MDENGNGRVAHADPSKKFFIDMLTRDIGLAVCIMDLIDNSVHSLVARSELDVSQHLIAGTQARKIRANVDISYGPSKFVVSDDCGGVSIQEAETHTFLLGNPIEEKTQTGLGVYGIGMKRAFFKIGRSISFQSHTTTEELKIVIDVEAWKRRPSDWTFPFTYARPKKTASGGTVIEITDLHPGVSEQFASKAFKAFLNERISTTYSLFLKAGLTIKVNGEEQEADFPELAETKNLRAVRRLIREGEVDILIMAGLSPVSDRVARGWYIFCNGRLVLDADNSPRTGWGTDSRPKFHPKYNHFLGYAYFRSKNVQKLPWTTTKDDVDQESRIYQRALAEMWIQSRPVLDFLNDLYPSDAAEESEPERALFRAATAISPQRVAKRANTEFRATVRKQTGDTPVSIQYKRPMGKLEKIRDVLGKGRMSASRIGEYTFDWFYDRNCK